MEKQYIASLSYGKDSMAMLHVITDVLHWPLDRIITADVWATDTIPADLPPMVEFKQYADAEIKKRWGIEVEHFKSEATFESGFYFTRGRTGRKTKFDGRIYGFPMQRGQWCLQQLKIPALKKARQSAQKSIEYIGIASDEPNRFHNITEVKRAPLVEAEWTEQMCREWCEQNNLLSPIYTTSTRGGCWFCHNQGVNQLRLLRKNYPDLWALLLKWDNDSPVFFHPDGRTVHDFDRRFRWEDEGYKPMQNQFRWDDVKYPQMNIEQILMEKEEQS